MVEIDIKKGERIYPDIERMECRKQKHENRWGCILWKEQLPSEKDKEQRQHVIEHLTTIKLIDIKGSFLNILPTNADMFTAAITGDEKRSMECSFLPEIRTLKCKAVPRPPKSLEQESDLEFEFVRKHTNE